MTSAIAPALGRLRLGDLVRYSNSSSSMPDAAIPMSSVCREAVLPRGIERKLLDIPLTTSRFE